MGTARIKSVLDDGEAERQSALERLGELTDRVQAANTSIVRDLGKLVAEVKGIEADRAKRQAEHKRVEAEKREALNKQLMVTQEQHRKMSAIHDELLHRLARVKDTLA